MNSPLQHPIENIMSCGFDFPRSLDEISGSQHARELRHKLATTRYVVEHSDIAVTGTFGRNATNEVFWHPIKICGRHSNPLGLQPTEQALFVCVAPDKSNRSAQFRSAASLTVISTVHMRGALLPVATCYHDTGNAHGIRPAPLLVLDDGVSAEQRDDGECVSSFDHFGFPRRTS